jgi:RHS repeat-associated protein
VVYAPVQVYGAGIYNWEGILDEFPTTTNWGRRYLVEVVNGDTRVNGVIVSVNGQQFVGSSECGNGVASVSRVIDNIANGSQSNELEVLVKGTTSSYVTLRICHVPDPTFPVYGFHTFTRQVPIAAERDSFIPSYAAVAPYTLRVINGAGDGSHRVTSATLDLNDVGILGPSDFGTGIATISRGVSLPDSEFLEDVESKIQVLNESATGTYFTAQIRATDDSAPVLTVSGPAEGLLTEASSVTVSGGVDDQTPVTVTIAPGGTPIQTNTTFSQGFAMAADGNYTIIVHAENSACLSSADTLHVARDHLAPTLTIDRPSANFAAIDSTNVTISGWWADTTATVVTVDGDTVGTGRYGTISIPNYPLDVGPNRIVFRAIDALGHTTNFTRFVFRKSPGDAVVIDSLVAKSNLSETGITRFLDQVKFLYTGDTQGDTLQKGVVANSIEPDLASVVHGRVTTRDFGGAPNVAVRVLGHDEFGYTLTRADGRFDLVVNGGSQITLRFLKSDYLEAQRDVRPPVNDYEVLDNVALIGKSTRMNVVPLDATRLVRGRFASDLNGDREIRLLFAAGTVAKIARAVGDTASLDTIRLHLTEYTVGSDGARTMPAILPPGSAYTYCIDFSVDEADSIGRLSQAGLPVPDVVFTNPVVCYVRNFLGFPVGAAVPNGYYDRRLGKWIAAEDGWVVKILTDSAGTVTIDSNGDGLADGSSRLASLGVTTAELQQLSAQFDANDVIWRMRVRRFSNADYNPNLAAIQAALSPAGKRAGQPQGLIDEACQVNGSIIECENRVLGQRVPVVGTPYTLNYRSFRAPGDSAIRTLRIPLTGDTLPPGINNIIVLLEAAGTRQRQDFTPQTNKVVTMTWNGEDVFGRPVVGSVNARLSIGYQYGSAYVSGSGNNSLGNPTAHGVVMGSSTGDRAIGRIAWSRQTVSLGAASTGSDGLGGWTISPHHFYDMTGQGALYYGDGRVRLGWRQYPIFNTVAGQPNCSSPNPDPDGNPAKGTSIPCITPNDVAVGPDGTLYLADALHGAILKLGRDGIFHRIAGQHSPGSYVGDTVGTATPLKNPTGITVGPDGSIYFVMSEGDAGTTVNRACRLTPDGRIHTIAGTGAYVQPGTGDGGPATDATFAGPSAIALGPDGSIYVGDAADHKVRRIGPDGIITTYAGTGENPGGGGAGIPTEGRADSIPLVSVNGLTCDADGNLYIAEGENHRVRRVAPDGIMTSFTGASSNFKPYDIAFGPDGAMYIASYAESRVYRRDGDGTLASIAGVGASAANTTDEGMPAAGASLYNPRGIDVAADGSIYVAEVSGRRLVRLGWSLPTATTTEFSIPSDDGAEVYFFDPSGRHLRTRDALTGAVRYRFDYDEAGRLLEIHDANGDATVITRSNGNPTGILAPYGQQTTLTMDGSWLGTIKNPNNETITLSTRTDGLLWHFEDARHHAHTFTYAGDGRLQLDEDPAGGSQTLDIDPSGLTRTVTRTTAGGRSTTYVLKDLLDGTRQRSITGPDNLRVYMSDSTDGKFRIASPDGTVQTDSLIPDPRFGMLAPVLGRSSEHLPSGLVRTIEVARSNAGYNPPFTVNPFTESVRVNERDPFVTSFSPDNHRLTVTSPVGREVVCTVDSAGRPLAVHVGGLDTLRYSYDARGNVIHLQQGSSRAWVYTYDSSGRLESVQDTLGRTTSFSYDAADRVTEEGLPGSRQVDFGYDANSNLASLTSPERTEHAFDYTAVDLRDRYRPPTAGLSASATQYRYDTDRLLIGVERPDSANVTLGYEASPNSGRLNAITIPRGLTRSYYRAAGGQFDSLSSPDTVTVHYDYDGPLVTSESWTGRVNGGVTHTYNRDFRPATQSINGGSSVSFGYDDDGLLTSAGALSVQRLTTNGLVDSTTLASNITSRQDYNGAGEVMNLHYAYSGNTLFQQSYTRDQLGRIRSIAEEIQGDTISKVYAYDDAGRLSQVWEHGVLVGQYGYDENGNRTTFTGATAADTATGTYDDQDRLLRYGNTVYNYGLAGELASSTTGTETTSYIYDPLGNLVTVELPGADRIDYLVDGRNRRVGRKLNGLLDKTWIYQDGLNPVAELDGEGNLLVRYVYASRGHVPDYMVKGGATYRLVTDLLGSVRLAVNVETGAVLQRIDYDAWGVRTTDPAPNFQALGYAGGLSDSATELVRFGARDYDPTLGRWSTKDPALFRGLDYNLYSYVWDDPLDNLDPSGLRPLTPCERDKLRPFIPEVDLIHADINTDKRNITRLLPAWVAGVTIDNQISFRPGAYDPSTPEGLGLLAHELIHVGQYRNGMTPLLYWLSALRGYGNSIFEQQAYMLQVEITRELTEADGAPCSCGQ